MSKSFNKFVARNKIGQGVNKPRRKKKRGPAEDDQVFGKGVPNLSNREAWTPQPPTIEARRRQKRARGF